MMLVIMAAPQEVEDARPDEQTPALNADGSTRRQHPAEPFEDDADGDALPGPGAGEEDNQEDSEGVRGVGEAGKRRRLLDRDPAARAETEREAEGETVGEEVIMAVGSDEAEEGGEGQGGEGQGETEGLEEGEGEHEAASDHEGGGDDDREEPEESTEVGMDIAQQ